MYPLEQERFFFADTLYVGNPPSIYERISLLIPRGLVHELEAQPLYGGFLLTWVGYYSHALGHYADRSRDKAYFPDYVLQYCEKGSGFLKVQDHYVRIAAGDLFLCPANLPHQYGSDPTDPWDVYWACFRGQIAEDIMRKLGLSNNNPVLRLGAYAGIGKAFYEIFDILKGPPVSGNVLHASARLFCLLTELAARQQYENGATTAGFDVNAILNLMYRNVGANLDLDFFANAAGMSRHYFERRFSAVVGNSVMQHFTLLKMHRACDLLTGTNLTVKQISQLLSFSSPYYFSQRFSQLMGVSPRQYRTNFHGRPHFTYI